MIKVLAGLMLVMALPACVQQADLDAWKGQPVAALDSHPFFNTLPMDKKVLADGTEIRNYVNGMQMSQCSGSAFGNAYGASASAFGNQSCFETFAACNNQFYIRGGRVIEYVPVATGGAICMTDQRVRPRAIGQ